MLITRAPGLLTLSLLCLLAIPAPGALGAPKKKAPARPTVRSVAPLKAGVGDQLTIKGANFVLGRKRDTVYFKAGTRPAVFAKAEQATRTTIKVIIPRSVERYMTVKGGVLQPTRFRLRILARRFGRSFTALRLSPTISPANRSPGPGPGTASPGPISGPAADCDGDGVFDSADGDDDNDLLSDAQEIDLKLRPCGVDSDGDGLEDGFERQSALDLNNTLLQNLPYPGKRPYPNPLDGTDAGTDYDGDGLSGAQEHLMWKTFGPRTLALNYSAGLKRSLPADPDSDERVDDDERDIDKDQLSNWDEFNGRMTPEWWLVAYPAERPYTEPYAGTSAIDSDSDGDTRLDGADDTDHDLWTNLQEISRAGSGRRVQPFNPCLPNYNSPTCSKHPPFTGSYPPFDVAGPLPLPPLPWP